MADKTYKNALEIDKNNLDEECVWTASLIDHWASLESEANENRDRLKDKLEMVKAETELLIRTAKPEFLEDNYNWPKNKTLTEAAVKAMLLLDEDVAVAQSEFEEARKQAREIGVARKSFEKRHGAIDNLVKLYGTGYFSRLESTEIKDSKLKALREKMKNQIRNKKGEK